MITSHNCDNIFATVGASKMRSILVFCEIGTRKLSSHAFWMEARQFAKASQWGSGAAIPLPRDARGRKSKPAACSKCSDIKENIA